jgi:hypothetical protein
MSQLNVFGSCFRDETSQSRVERLNELRVAKLQRRRLHVVDLVGMFDQDPD